MSNKNETAKQFVMRMTKNKSKLTIDTAGIFCIQFDREIIGIGITGAEAWRNSKIFLNSNIGKEFLKNGNKERKS